MIPATQRPDGTWRKARKIRTGFSSSSGGATRYVPPAFRNTASGSAKDGDILVGHGHARSLGEVAATGGKGGSRRFLNAALFLLTSTPAPSATAEIEIEAGTGGGSTGGSRAGGPALSSPLRSAARCAKETLGCEDCRVLSPDPAATASDPGAAMAPAGVAMGREESESNDGQRSSRYDATGSCDDIRSDRDQKGGNRHNASGGDDWWAGLRQVERGWISSESDHHEGSPSPKAREILHGESWIGLHLKLRPSDVCCVEGRAAIVEFLKGRVGKQVAGSEEEEEEEEHAKGGEDYTHLKEITKPKESTSSPAGATTSAAAGGQGEARQGKGGLPTSSRSGSTDSGTGQEPGVHLPRQAARGEATVVVAVLVFGSELSKRDRAELHGQAEKAGGVASSSHGVGGERFLSLTCGLGSRAGAVELELSPEKAELARRLFRLAQQEYHSRYECLSHREIREVVFRGGPSAQDHPDLFRLMEKHLKTERDMGGPPKKGNRGGKGNTNKETVGSTGSMAPGATETPSSEQSGIDASSAVKNEQLRGAVVDVAQSAATAAAVFLPPPDSEGASEQALPSSSVRGHAGMESVEVVEEGHKIAEPTGSREKCPW